MPRGGPGRPRAGLRRAVAALLLAGALAMTDAATGAGNAALRSGWMQTSDGVRLHVLEAGPPAAPDRPVLAFVPGWSMPASIWEPQLAELARRHPVAALDPRGQGRSDVPADGYDADRRAADIAEFLDRYPRSVLIGWSLGALEALHCVHRGCGPGVAGLVLVDSSVGEPPAPAPGDFLDRLRARREPVLRDFVRAIFRSTRPQAEIDALVGGAMRMPLAASVALLSYPYPREHWRDIARAFPRPLMYVVTPQFAEQADSLARHRAGTRIEVFRDAGHALFVDRPARFNRLLEEFVAGL